MTPLIPFFLFLLGAVLGSFANVVIYRWPREESVVWPGSRCGSCQKPVAFYDNIPILSWFVLRGRCRHCKAPYSFRYVVVEAFMAVLFVLIYHFNGLEWVTIEYLLMAFGLVTASFIDIDHFLLPDVITLSGLVIGLVGAAVNPDRSFWEALAGAFFGGFFLWSIAAIYQLLRKQEGMGGGDIKLLAWLGAVVGWRAIPFVIITASITGSILGLALAARKNDGKHDGLKTMIPFGPYLAFGAILYICGGQELAHSYLRFFIPEL